MNIKFHRVCFHWQEIEANFITPLVTCYIIISCSLVFIFSILKLRKVANFFARKVSLHWFIMDVNEYYILQSLLPLAENCSKFYQTYCDLSLLCLHIFILVIDKISLLCSRKVLSHFFKTSVSWE